MKQIILLFFILCGCSSKPTIKITRLEQQKQELEKLKFVEVKYLKKINK